MNFKTDRIIVTLLALALVSSVLAISIPKVHAATTAVRVMPQAMGFGGYSVVGTQFTITVDITDVTLPPYPEPQVGLYGFDIKFGWNTEWVQYVSHEIHVPVEYYPDGVLHEATGHPAWIVQDTVDELGVPGTPAGTMYWLGVASEDPSPFFLGSGVAFEMTFQIKKQPTAVQANAVINFHITQSQLADKLGFSITHDNYDATATIYKTGTLWHDVAVISVTNNSTYVNPEDTVDPGDDVDVTVVVKNLGDYTETFDVTAYNMTGYYATIIGTQTVSGLASKASTTLHFTWDTTGIDGDWATIKAVASTVSAETAFPFDNIRVDGNVYVRITGDATGDRTVDVFDVLKVKYHRSGPPPGPGGYNLDADINKDGVIDVFDILLVKANLRRTV